MCSVAAVTKMIHLGLNKPIPVYCKPTRYKSHLEAGQLHGGAAGHAQQRVASGNAAVRRRRRAHADRPAASASAGRCQQRAHARHHPARFGYSYCGFAGLTGRRTRNVMLILWFVTPLA